MALRGPPSDRDLDALREFGVVNVDKPPGPTSHQVSAWVRDLLEVDRAAHAGTLDPKVTGCLPVLVGDATRLSRALLTGAKEYVAVLELHGPPPADLDRVVAEFEAPLLQKPPRKSAVTRRLRVREIYELSPLEQRDRQVLLRIRCESGTYVRKLCHDLGLALGVGAHMGDLRRIGTGAFDDTSLVDLYELTDAIAFAEEGDEEALREVLLPAEGALTHLPRVIIAESAAREVATGAQVYSPGVIDVKPAERGDDDTIPDPAEEPLVACYTPNGAAVCLGELVGDHDAERGIVVRLNRVLV